MDLNFQQLFNAGSRLKPGSKQDLESGIRSAEGNLQRQMKRTSDLEERVDQLSLLCLSLWDLLKEKTGLTDDELQESIAKLSELRNEQQAQGAQRCPECDRVMSVRQSRCLYCSDPS